jgi:hypothetical protein
MLKKLNNMINMVLIVMAFSHARVLAQSLERVGSYDSLIAATDVVVSGQYAYVVDGIRGLVIFNISNPAMPTFVGSYNGPWNEMSLALQGGYIYLGSGSTEPYAGTFSVVDVSDPANPFLTDSLSFNWEVTTVEVADNGYAYIATYGGNYVVSVSDQYNIQIAGTFDTPGYPNDLKVHNNLYVADGQAGLTILSLADPINPQLLGNCDSPGIALSLSEYWRSGHFVYIADNDSGLAIIDVLYPTNPVLVNSIPIYGHVRDIEVLDSQAYANGYTAADSFLVVLNLSDLTSPEIVEQTAVSPRIWGLDVQNDYIYMACFQTLQIYTLGCHYIPGDINGNFSVNGVDIVYAIGYLKGPGFPPPNRCDICPEPLPFYAAGDVNGNCAFNGVDITFFVRYLKLQVPSLLYCLDCSPAGL